jgi:hypothetical protein
MKMKDKINAIERARMAAQEEWIIEFFKNKFQVSYTKVKEAISIVGNSHKAVGDYLGIAG